MIDGYWFDPGVLAMHGHIGCAGVSVLPNHTTKHALEACTLPDDIVQNIGGYIGRDVLFHLPLCQRLAPGAISAPLAFFSIFVEWVSEPGELKMIQRAWQIPVEIRPAIYRNWQWDWVSCMPAAHRLYARCRLLFNHHIDELFVSMPTRVQPTDFKLRVNGIYYMTWEDVEKIQTIVCADTKCYRLYLRVPDCELPCPILNFSELDSVNLEIEFEPTELSAAFDITLAASTYGMLEYNNGFYKNQYIVFEYR
jgi:hypothetical protein